MANDQRTSLCPRLLLSALLAAAVGPMVAGCGSMPDVIPGPLGSSRLLSADGDAATGTKAFKEAVRDDPFPTAGQSGVVRVGVQ